MFFSLRWMRRWVDGMVASVFNRIYRKLRIVALLPSYRRYVSGIAPNSPLRGIPSRIVGDASADPTEFLDHYAAFAYWSATRMAERDGPLKTLDIGSPKMFNVMTSICHDVTAVVLADCCDTISNVRYVLHDAAEPLPFPESYFDIFTSTVSLPLLGLARYGDRLDSGCIPRLISELARVMKPDGELLVSMCLGQNVLNFNNGWFFDMPTLRRIFRGWMVVDHLVDMGSSSYATGFADGTRFSHKTSVDDLPRGQYRVIFLRLRRAAAASH